jgi:hypothetical protein
VSTKSLHEITIRAEDMTKRGVRRVIAVLLERLEAERRWPA